MRILRLALITLMLSATGACSLVSHDSGRAACAGEFDLNSLKEPLGSSPALGQELRRAVHDKNPVRLDELTGAAGWTEDWDLMADVASNTPEAELNGIVQTPGHCWKGLPAVQTPVPEGFYLFFKDRVPVQKVDWRGDSKPINLSYGVSLNPQSQLVASGRGLGPA
ncbi:hypothetical protein [Nocardia heshunensis]